MLLTRTTLHYQFLKLYHIFVFSRFAKFKTAFLQLTDYFSEMAPLLGNKRSERFNHPGFRKFYDQRYPGACCLLFAPCMISEYFIDLQFRNIYPAGIGWKF